MKILDLVDTSRNGTAHLRDVGELPIPSFNGTVPLTRAISLEDHNGASSTAASYTYVSFPDSGGIKIRRDTRCRSTSSAFTSGLAYLLDNLDPGLSDKLTQLNLSYSQTYLQLPQNWVSAHNDLSIVLLNDQGTQTFLRIGYLGSISGIVAGVKIKREVVVDRKRKSVSWYAKHPVTGVVTKSVTSYAAYTTMRFGGLVVGLAGRHDAGNSAGYSYNYDYNVLLEDILFTENDLPTDPPRHGNFELATLSDVVNSSHANAAVLNTPRKLTSNVAGRYTASTPVPITGAAPVAFSLRPTLLSDAAATGKGKCIAVMVTADLKNTAGKQVCKAALQDGRSSVFRTPRTHPFQQSQGMPGIGATVAQIDVRLPNGDIDASSLTKTITLSVN
jgi:hypothetical protein